MNDVKVLFIHECPKFYAHTPQQRSMTEKFLISYDVHRSLWGVGCSTFESYAPLGITGQFTVAVRLESNVCCYLRWQTEMAVATILLVVVAIYPKSISANSICSYKRGIRKNKVNSCTMPSYSFLGLLPKISPMKRTLRQIRFFLLFRIHLTSRPLRWEMDR